jgi:hypothetical protein
MSTTSGSFATLAAIRRGSSVSQEILTKGLTDQEFCLVPDPRTIVFIIASSTKTPR